jgi:SAM-dependent methyltransferase
MTARHFNPVKPDTALKWVQVPCDWRKGPDTAGATVYFDTQRGFGQVWPRPSASEIAQFYDLAEYYTHQAEQGISEFSFENRLLRRLSWMLDRGTWATSEWWRSLLGKGPLRILDLGCGDGQIMACLAGLGHDVIGVEPDQKALACAIDKGLTVYPGRAEELPPELLSRKFDVILFMHSLEHSLDPELALVQARRLLVPRGRLVIELPNSLCLGHEHFGPLWLWLDLPRHLNFFTAESLGDLLAAQGFRVDKLDYVGFSRAFQADWRIQQARIAQAFGQEIPNIWRYWSYLARTAFAARQRRYDTFRMVATAAD